jgi:hypothetical protein
VPGFTNRYDIHQLVWFEAHQSRDTGLQREKQIKEGKQDWKTNLIEHEKRHWTDLSFVMKSIPAEAGIHGRNGHRPSPVRFDISIYAAPVAPLGG